jgi:hypothetical protein
MRTAIVSLFLLLPGMAFAQQDTKFYTPEKKIDAPTFINAEVVRVNRDNTATFRSESGEITLTADDSTTAALGALHPGDKVLVEYREVKGPSGRMTRYVTSVKEASPTSGEPGRGRAVVGTVAVVPAVLPAGTVSGQAVAVVPASDTGATGPVAVVPGADARDRSPFVSTVPSIPAAPPAPGVVLPPAGAKEPLSADDVGQMRAQGERDLAASAVSLAAAAAAIDPVWAGFKSQCLSSVNLPAVTAGRDWYVLAEDRIPTPPDDACRAMFADLTGRTRGFLSQLETVEDAARKADVLPARVREVLDRHKL